MARSPKPKLGGVTDRCPCTPVPLNPIVKLRSEALLVIAMLPGTSPVVTGAKWAARLMLCPADSLNSVVSPLLKPLPQTQTREIVTQPFPVLLSLRVFELFCPMPTSPKHSLGGVTDR